VSPFQYRCLLRDLISIADVTKITVRVKASAALTPGRGPGLADHQSDCTETAEAFPAAASLLLLRGAFDDVELQATVNPVGTPLAWDVKRATDDAAALGAGLPTLVPDPVDLVASLMPSRVSLRPADQPIQARKSIRVVRLRPKVRQTAPLLVPLYLERRATDHGKP
jgi:hypothetical protein